MRSGTAHRSMREVSPMEYPKIYLLAELTIAPGFLEEVKAILKEALIPTLQEPGREILYETGRRDDPGATSQARNSSRNSYGIKYCRPGVHGQYGLQRRDAHPHDGLSSGRRRLDTQEGYC